MKLSIGLSLISAAEARLRAIEFHLSSWLSRMVSTIGYVLFIAVSALLGLAIKMATTLRKSGAERLLIER